MNIKLLFVVALLTCLPSLASARQPLDIDRIVAVVNDEAITLYELQDRLKSVERQLRSRGTSPPPSDELQRQLLERMIMDRLQVQYAREIGLSLDDDQLDIVLEDIASRNQMSMEQFRAALEDDGISWSTFREDMRDEVIMARLRDREVNARISISEGEIDNYLQGHSQGLRSAAAEVGHIIVRLPEHAGEAEQLRLRERAEEALRRIRAGEDFAAVAASVSDAPDALQGGILERRSINRLPALYADAAMTLKVDEVSDVLRSPAGFHIIKLFSREGTELSGSPIRQTLARHILIRTDELTNDDEARHKLLGLRERISNGADFAELARRYSSDGSAARGGDLGWLYAGDTDPAFESAMDQLQPGEISQPVRSSFGWHLIEVLQRKNAEAGERRKRLLARQALRESKEDETYEQWLRQLRDSAYVDNRLEDRQDG